MPVDANTRQNLYRKRFLSEFMGFSIHFFAASFRCSLRNSILTIVAKNKTITSTINRLYALRWSLRALEARNALPIDCLEMRNLTAERFFFFKQRRSSSLTLPQNFGPSQSLERATR